MTHTDTDTHTLPNQGADFCAVSAFTSTSVCFDLSENSIPTRPRFENAGLWRKGGGEVQLRGKRDRIDAHAQAKCEVGIDV